MRFWPKNGVDAVVAPDMRIAHENREWSREYWATTLHEFVAYFSPECEKCGQTKDAEIHELATLPLA